MWHYFHYFMWHCLVWSKYISYYGLKLSKGWGFQYFININKRHIYIVHFNSPQHLCLLVKEKKEAGVMWISCGLLWCFYQLFGLSFWRHPFTAEDPLVSKWCNVKFLQICSDGELIYILDILRVSKLLANFRFWVNSSSYHIHSNLSFIT